MGNLIKTEMLHRNNANQNQLPKISQNSKVLRVRFLLFVRQKDEKQEAVNKVRKQTKG